MSTVTVSVYGKKAEVNPDNPSFSFHTGKVLPYIEIFAIVGDSGRGWREKFKVTSQEVARQQIEEVLKFFNDTRDGVEKERIFYEFYQQPESFDWIDDDEGLSGWLDPEGVFHPCGFGEHVKYALEIWENDESRGWRVSGNEEMETLLANQHISMSYGEQSTGGFMSILGKLTPPQVEWFNQYFYKLAPATQRTPLVRAAKEQGIKLKYHW